MPELQSFDESELISDDLMPNEAGSQVFDPFHADEEVEHEQRVASSTERAMILGAEPLLDEIFKWIDFAIEDCDSINHIDPKLTISMEAQMYGMKHAKKKLNLARGRLVALRETYIDKNLQ